LNSDAYFLIKSCKLVFKESLKELSLYRAELEEKELRARKKIYDVISIEEILGE